MRRRLALVAAALLLPLLGGPAVARPSSGAAGCAGAHWVGSWAADPGYTYLPGYAAQTLRLALSPHLGGDRLRIRLSNRFGSGPVRIDAVSVARAADRDTAALVPGTVRPVTFAGRRFVVLPAGRDVTSDPVALTFPPFAHLAVSLYVAGPTGPATEHFDGHQLSWAGPGDLTSSESAAGFGLPTWRWPFLAGVDVLAPASVGAVVTFGDSITDGFQDLAHGAYVRTLDLDERYPDFLAGRLGGSPALSVVNAGISGNKVLADATGEGVQLGYGPSALHRLGADALAVPGVTDVVVLEGTNDIGDDGASAPAVIGGLREVVRRLHAAGLRVQLGTLTPRSDGISAAQQSALSAVNAWIRGQHEADGMIDFAAAVRDPGDHARLDPAYDSGDGLHPNSAGYRAMANAIDLGALAGPGCAGR